MFSVVVMGELEFYTSGKRGCDRNIMWRLYPHSFFGQGALLGEEVPRNFEVITRTRCSIAELHVDALDSVLNTYLKDIKIDFMELLVADYSDRLTKLISRVDRGYLCTVRDMLRETFLILVGYPDAERHYEGVVVTVSITDLGSWAGCSREMAGRLVKQMQEENLLERNGYKILLYGRYVDGLNGARGRYILKMSSP